MKSALVIITVIILAGAGIIYAYNLRERGNERDVKENGFISISTAELAAMLDSKNFKLLDVHTPEQEHILGTDAVIPYNQIDKITDFAPDKSEKIVLYCRSGSMSKIAADDLVKRGYTNIFELEKGMNAWLEEGREIIPEGFGETLKNIEY